MKRSYTYLLSAGVVAIIFGSMAVAQQKSTTLAVPNTLTAVETLETTASIASSGVFDIKSMQTMAVGVERGQKTAAALCASCHNADGNSIVSIQPKIAGQHEAYIYKQLKDYQVAEGATEALRSNAIMAGQVAPLSDGDMKSLSAWFASQTLTPSTAQIDDPKMSELGEKIYKSGIASKGLPACAACHGPTGAGMAAQYPRVSGQFSTYLETQLKNFRDEDLEGGRKNNVPMQEIAQRMTDTEIQAVSDYMAGVR